MKIITAILLAALATPAAADGIACRYEKTKVDGKRIETLRCDRETTIFLRTVVQKPEVVSAPASPEQPASAPGVSGNATVGTDADGKLIFR